MTPSVCYYSAARISSRFDAAASAIKRWVFARIKGPTLATPVRLEWHFPFSVSPWATIVPFLAFIVRFLVSGVLVASFGLVPESSSFVVLFASGTSGSRHGFAAYGMSICWFASPLVRFETENNLAKVTAAAAIPLFGCERTFGNTRWNFIVRYTCQSCLVTFCLSLSYIRRHNLT